MVHIITKLQKLTLQSWKWPQIVIFGPFQSPPLQGETRKGATNDHFRPLLSLKHQFSSFEHLMHHFWCWNGTFNQRETFIEGPWKHYDILMQHIFRNGTKINQRITHFIPFLANNYPFKYVRLENSFPEYLTWFKRWKFVTEVLENYSRGLETFLWRCENQPWCQKGRIWSIFS